MKFHYSCENNFPQFGLYLVSVVSEKVSFVDNVHVDIAFIKGVNPKLFPPFKCFKDTINSLLGLFSWLVKNMFPKPKIIIRLWIEDYVGLNKTHLET